MTVQYTVKVWRDRFIVNAIKTFSTGQKSDVSTTILNNDVPSVADIQLRIENGFAWQQAQIDAGEELA
jgi:hypothetical protein